MIGGNAVLPTVCATGWMAVVSERIFQDYTFFSIDNYRLFKGITFDGSEPDEVTMKVVEIARTNDRIDVKATIGSVNAKGFPVNHYVAELTLLKKIPAAPKYMNFEQSDQRGQAKAELYSNGTLFHGPLFQGIDHVMNVSGEKLTLGCLTEAVNEGAQGQFPVGTTNPYVDDLLYQAMLVWVRLNVGNGSLPSLAKRIEQYRLVPVEQPYFLSLDVVEVNSKKLVADITLHDKEGLIYIKMLGAEVTISEKLNELFKVKSLS